MPTTDEQRCRTCGEMKPLDEFHRDRTKKTGHRVECKSCVKAYGAARYRANVEAHRAWRRDYYETNREKILATQREYAARNADKVRAKAREYRELNPEVLRWSGIRSRYGITKERYEAIWLAQGERCPICLSSETEGLHIDHDHSCCPGKKSCGSCVRGLLCSSCNLLLGHAKDNRATLKAAVAYLSSYVQPTDNVIELSKQG